MFIFSLHASFSRQAARKNNRVFVISPVPGFDSVKGTRDKALVVFGEDAGLNPATMAT